MNTHQPRWTIAPYFLVDDLVATANYYRDRLGFSYERFWGEPPVFCMVRRRGITIMLSQQARTAPVRPNHRATCDGEAWDAYVWVENADALHEEFTNKGVAIARGLCDQEYGMREFDIKDCNGYIVCFGHDLGAR